MRLSLLKGEGKGKREGSLYFSTELRGSQIRKYLGGYFLRYSPYFFGDSSELRKRPFGCAQPDDMADLTEIPGTDYLTLAGVGENIASNLSFYSFS